MVWNIFQQKLRPAGADWEGTSWWLQVSLAWNLLFVEKVDWVLSLWVTQICNWSLQHSSISWQGSLDVVNLRIYFCNSSFLLSKKSNGYVNIWFLIFRSTVPPNLDPWFRNISHSQSTVHGPRSAVFQFHVFLLWCVMCENEKFVRIWFALQGGGRWKPLLDVIDLYSLHEIYSQQEHACENIARHESTLKESTS